MEQYLAEKYVSGAKAAAQSALVRRLIDGDAHVRLLQSFYLPADELSFYLVESDSAERVAGVAAFDRISPAIAP